MHSGDDVDVAVVVAVCAVQFRAEENLRYCQVHRSVLTRAT